MLALGGGGARGFAHIGVLQALEGAGIRPRAIAGTSMGAVVGAMYLAYGSVERVVELWRAAIAEELVPVMRSLSPITNPESREHPLLRAARRFRNRVVISMAISRTTMLEAQVLTEALEALVPDVALGDLGRPFVAVATDLATGEEVRLSSGALRSALKASSSIPGLVPAVPVGDRLLVDGGVVAEVPVRAARELGWPVVAVDVSMNVPPLVEDALALDTMMRTQTMTAGLLRRCQLQGCRHLIRPAVGHATWADWGRFDELVEAGRRAATAWLGCDREAPHSGSTADHR